MTRPSVTATTTPADDLGLSNPDLAPLPPERRRWTWWNYSTIWMGIVHNIVAWQVAANLIALGMSFWQALGCVCAAYGVAFAAILANSVLGARHGVPFPVLVRAPFGYSAAQIPVFLRAFVAVFWFAVHIYIGSKAIGAVLSVAIPHYRALGHHHVLGMGVDVLIAFVICWLVHAYIVGHGIDTVRKFEVWAGPSIMVLAIGLVIWAASAAGGLGPLTNGPSTIAPGAFWSTFFLSMSALLGTVATLVLNIADMTRFARSQRDQAIGQGIGFPVMFFLFSAMGLLAAEGTRVAFGTVITNPIDILTRFGNPVVAVLGAACVLVATASVNVATNGVSAGFDLTNLAPRLLNFRRSGMLAVIAAVVFAPWLWYDESGAISDILGAIGATMGPVTGIMLADFYLIRHRRYDVAALYSRDPADPYTYVRGWNPVALIAFALGVLVALSGLFVPPLKPLYNYNWFLGVAVGALVHVAGTALSGQTLRRRQVIVSSRS
ncbi:NCS1 family nucleobase:cation symporter-1 [Actinoallomurus sp. NBC_01490]|jgi:NCS1 family nucleobase:cation symporter-1|uniref:NCS1 family nucleobase:cation symporter-1 n=1 Tax=Actinoallomurus sp. NBC_01490 TaxID=2903557 RepID=UPI002E3509F0|nr:NCS1 family nucleobase:cation symporter-1 [Actinoallomurus sp. NBC_01490]